MENAQTAKVRDKEEQYPLCQGHGCGAQIISIVGGHFYVTLETPWGETVKSGPFCGECAVNLAKVGVHLHDIEAIHREMGIKDSGKPKSYERLPLADNIRMAAVKMIAAAPDLAEGLEPRHMAAAALLAAVTLGSHQMNEATLREGLAELIKLTAPLRQQHS